MAHEKCLNDFLGSLTNSWQYFCSILTVMLGAHNWLVTFISDHGGGMDPDKMPQCMSLE